MAKRGRPKETPVEEQPVKYSRVYEDELSIRTWKYDLSITDRGPIEVSIVYKPGAEKLQRQMAKQAKIDRRINREMRKINSIQDAKLKTKTRGRKKKIK
jgi:hypothetical protein